MSLYVYLKRAWKRPHGQEWRQRLIQFRKEPATLKLDRPTRLDRARSLGYKPKQGIFVVRQRVLRGGHVRPRPPARKSKRMSISLALRKNYQQIAEQRAQAKFSNCEVLNSYWVGQDGQHYWYEIVMVDRSHPHATAYVSWVRTSRGRAYRGLTSAGRLSRGLRWKGKGAEKARPSRRAKDRRL